MVIVKNPGYYLKDYCSEFLIFKINFQILRFSDLRFLYKKKTSGEVFLLSSLFGGLLSGCLFSDSLFCSSLLSGSFFSGGFSLDAIRGLSNFHQASLTTRSSILLDEAFLCSLVIFRLSFGKIFSSWVSFESFKYQRFLIIC